MTAQANVVLSINSIAKTAGVLAAVAALAKLASITKEMIFEGEKFSKVNRNLAIDITAAAKASKDQIDTMAMLQGAMKIQQSGNKITAKQFADLSKLIASFSEKTGTDATQNFEKFSTALSRGSARALRPLGIDLKEGGSLAENFADAMDQVAERAKYATVEADDLQSSMYALDNSFGTAKLALGGYISEASRGTGVFAAMKVALDEVKFGLDSFSKLMMETGPNFHAVLNSWDTMFKGFAIGFLETMGSIFSALADIPIIGDVYAKGTLALRTKSSELKSSLYEAFDEAQAKDDALPKPKVPIPVIDDDKDKRSKKKKAFDPGYQEDFSEWDVDFFNMVGMSREELGFGPSRPFIGSSVGDDQILDASLSHLSNEQLVERIDHQRELNALLEDRIGFGQAEYEFRKMYFDEELTFAEDFRSAWTNAMDGISAGTLAARSAADLLRTAWYDAAYAIIEGNKSAGQAILEALKKVGLALAVESSLRALYEGAQAIAAEARRDVQAARKHWSSAAAFTGLAVLGGAVAGGAHLGMKASGSKGGGGGGSFGSSGSSEGAGRSYGYGGSPGNSQSRGPVVVVLEGGAEGIFRVVEDENRRAAISGRSSFATSS